MIVVGIMNTRTRIKIESF